MKSLFGKFVLMLAIPAAAFISSCSHMENFVDSGEKWDPSKKSTNGLPLKPSEKTREAAAKISKTDRHGYKTYNDAVRTRLVRTTAFSHQEREKGAPGRKNCLGGTLKYGKVRSAAADWSVYPVGTKFRIKGLPHLYVVDDYGSALAGTNTIDIFHPTLRSMRKWGTREAQITIVQWGDYERSLKVLGGRIKYAHCRKMYTHLQGRMSRGELADAEVTSEEISKL